jgi:hypothetical protein
MLVWRSRRRRRTVGLIVCCIVWRGISRSILGSRCCGLAVPWCHRLLTLSGNNSGRNPFAGEMLELRQERPCRRRPFHRASQDFFVGQGLTVKLGVLVQILTEGSTLQGQTGEDTMRSRPRQDFCRHQNVGIRARVASDRPGSGSGFSAKREFIRQQFFHAALVEHQHNDIGGGPAELQAKATLAFHRQIRALERRLSPQGRNGPP